GALTGLRQQRHLARPLIGAQTLTGLAADKHLAAIPLHAGQAVEQGGLARAVRADDAQHFAGRQGQIDALQALVHAQVLGTNQLHFCRSRHTSQMNSGAPISEVSTPSLSSRPGGSSRTTRSAQSTSVAPANIDGISRRSGRCRTSGRIRCGTTRPTKPMAPATATAEPTSTAAPSTISRLPRLTFRPRLCAVCSPRLRPY